MLREGIAQGLIHSAHDCAEGGLAVALASVAHRQRRRGRRAGVGLRPPSLGAALTLPAGAPRPDLALFGEGPSPVVLTCAAGDADALARLAGGLPLTILGTVTGDRLQVALDGSPAIDLSIDPPALAGRILTAVRLPSGPFGFPLRLGFDFNGFSSIH